MIFYKDGLAVTLDSPAQYPYTQNTQLSQVKELSGSGITHVEDFDVLTGTYTYNFEDISNEDHTKIIEWFTNTAEGMLNVFELTDDLGVVRDVRFTESRLEFALNDYGLWGGSFTVEVQI